MTTTPAHWKDPLATPAAGPDSPAGELDLPTGLVGGLEVSTEHYSTLGCCPGFTNEGTCGICPG